MEEIKTKPLEINVTIERLEVPRMKSIGVCPRCGSKINSTGVLRRPNGFFDIVSVPGQEMVKKLEAGEGVEVQCGCGQELVAKEAKVIV